MKKFSILLATGLVAFSTAFAGTAMAATPLVPTDAPALTKKRTVDYGKFGKFHVSNRTVNGRNVIYFKKFGASKKAHVATLYNSTTYLHVSNAAYYCRQWMNQSADDTMYYSVGYHVWWYNYEQSGDPYYYTRHSNTVVGVDDKWTSYYNAYYAVEAACGVQGSDAYWSIYAVAMGTVYRN